MKKYNKLSIIMITTLLLTMSASLILAQDYLPRTWKTRKVELQFNRYYDWKEMEQALRKLENAFPKFLKLNSIGQSYNGR